jgi:hypothetical protein
MVVFAFEPVSDSTFLNVDIFIAVSSLRMQNYAIVERASNSMAPGKYYGMCSQKKQLNPLSSIKCHF